MIALLLQASSLPQEYGEALLIAFGAVVAAALYRQMDGRATRAEKMIDDSIKGVVTAASSVTEVATGFREFRSVMVEAVAGLSKLALVINEIIVGQDRLERRISSLEKALVEEAEDRTRAS